MAITADFQFEYEGFLFGDGTSYEVTSVEGLDLPPLRTQDTPYSAKHGAFSGASYFDGRLVLIDTEVVAASGAALETLLAALTDAVTPYAGVGVLKFQLPGQGIRRINAEVRDRRMRVDHDYARAVARPILQFYAADPRIYSDTLTAVAVGLTATALSNSGDFPAPTVIRFTNNSGSTISDPTVVDSARGREINLDISIGNGDYVELDGLARTAIRSTDGASVRSNVTRWDEMDVPPAGVSWTKTTGLTVTATYRDTWI